MKKIEPTILKGTRDFLPGEMKKRNFVLDKIRRIFERFGYEPIETPILSPAETILGKYGEEGDRLTYTWKDAGDRDVALPYDLTVPFARYAAANWRELPMPFKRYQIQRVWRAEKPQKGRLREFYQCDIDVIGTRSLLAEAEIARVIVEVFTELGITDFKIKLNSRRLINAVFQWFGEESKTLEGLRIIDKLEKIGYGNVLKELEDLGVQKAYRVMEILTKKENNAKTLDDFATFNFTETNEVQEFLKLSKQLGVDERYLQFDPSLARGLDYYTGIIFEVVAKNSDFGTLAAGGRYDNLTELFETSAPKGDDTSGVGVAFGFERIMLLMEEMGILADVQTGSKVLVAQFEETRNETIEIFDKLIAAGIPAEIYFEPAKIEKQLKFANKKNIPFVLMCGPEEAANNVVVLKDMTTGEENKVSSREAVDMLRS